jgi:hypothetical protein
VDEIGESKLIENYGLKLTLERISHPTPGVVKRVFKLSQALSGGGASDEDMIMMSTK